MALNRLQAGERRNRVTFSAHAQDFSVLQCARPAWTPTQPPIQEAQGDNYLGEIAAGA
jgi:hypothetical protein